VIGDQAAPRPVLSSRVRLDGAVWSVRTDEVDLGAAGVVTRDVVVHGGAVAAFAVDADDRVVLVRQYRHPVAAMLWEPPAGLCDADGESLLDTAVRELAEEADLTASAWHTLVDLYLTPGGSTERLRVFLAEGLADVRVADRHVRVDEEADLEIARVPFAEVLDAVLAGTVHNPALIAGTLALAAHRGLARPALRPPDAPWLL